MICEFTYSFGRTGERLFYRHRNVIYFQTNLNNVAENLFISEDEYELGYCEIFTTLSVGNIYIVPTINRLPALFLTWDMEIWYFYSCEIHVKLTRKVHFE